MSKTYINGEEIGGTPNNANLVNCTDANGNPSTVQAVLDEQNNKIVDVEQSFQAGCNTIVGGCTAYGVTPKSNSPADIVTAIGEVYKLGVKNVSPTNSDSDTYPASASSGTITVTLPANSKGLLICSCSCRVNDGTTAISVETVSGVTLKSLGSLYTKMGYTNHEHREQTYLYNNSNNSNKDITVTFSASWNVLGAAHVIKIC